MTETAYSHLSAVPRSLLRTMAAEGNDAAFQKVLTPVRSHFQFLIDGVPYYARHDTGKGPHLSIWAVLGYMPYSAESPERRRMLIAILNATQHLENVKIGVDSEHKIVAILSCRSAEIQSPAFIFPSLILFLQEAVPYIKLIGEYL
jgi:hypothetical protein